MNKMKKYMLEKIVAWLVGGSLFEDIKQVELEKIDDIFMKTPEMFTHTHANGTTHTHKGGSLKHEHHNERLDRLGKEQRGPHHYY